MKSVPGRRRPIGRVIRRARAAFQAESVATPHGFQGLWLLISGLLQVGAAMAMDSMDVTSRPGGVSRTDFV